MLCRLEKFAKQVLIRGVFPWNIPKILKYLFSRPHIRSCVWIRHQSDIIDFPLEKHFTEAAIDKSSIMKTVLKYFAVVISWKSTCNWVLSSLFMKKIVRRRCLQTNCANFSEQCFGRTPPGGSFWVPTFSSRVSAEQNLHKSIWSNFDISIVEKNRIECRLAKVLSETFSSFFPSRVKFIESQESKKCCHGRVGVWVNGEKYSRMDQVKFVEDILDECVVCWGRPYHFKFFKGCLPQILLGPFLNTLTQLTYFKHFGLKWK